MTDTLRRGDRAPETSRQGWQYCRISVYVSKSGDSGEDCDKWISCWLHRYTPFGVLGKDVTGIEWLDTDGTEDILRKERLRTKVAYARLHDKNFSLGERGLGDDAGRSPKHR